MPINTKGSIWEQQCLIKPPFPREKAGSLGARRVCTVLPPRTTDVPGIQSLTPRGKSTLDSPDNELARKQEKHMWREELGFLTCTPLIKGGERRRNRKPVPSNRHKIFSPEFKLPLWIFPPFFNAFFLLLKKKKKHKDFPCLAADPWPDTPPVLPGSHFSWTVAEARLGVVTSGSLPSCPIAPILWEKSRGWIKVGC